MDSHEYDRLKARLEVVAEQWVKQQREKLDFVYRLSTGDLPPEEVLKESDEFLFSQKVSDVHQVKKYIRKYAKNRKPSKHRTSQEGEKRRAYYRVRYAKQKAEKKLVISLPTATNGTSHTA